MSPAKCECVKCQEDLQTATHFVTWLPLSVTSLHQASSMARKGSTKPPPEEEEESAEVPRKYSTRSAKKATPSAKTGECI